LLAEKWYRCVIVCNLKDEKSYERNKKGPKKVTGPFSLYLYAGKPNVYSVYYVQEVNGNS